MATVKQIGRALRDLNYEINHIIKLLDFIKSNVNDTKEEVDFCLFHINAAKLTELSKGHYYGTIHLDDKIRKDIHAGL
jgi:hypothetical protein